MSGLSASSSGCSTGPVGPPTVLRMDNGPELISQALQQFCSGKVGLSYIPPDNRGTTATSNRRHPRRGLPQWR